MMDPIIIGLIVLVCIVVLIVIISAFARKENKTPPHSPPTNDGVDFSGDATLGPNGQNANLYPVVNNRKPYGTGNQFQIGADALPGVVVNDELSGESVYVGVGGNVPIIKNKTIKNKPKVEELSGEDDCDEESAAFFSSNFSKTDSSSSSMR